MRPAAAAVLDQAAAAGARCGPAIAVAIDGPAGSGKTTLARAVRDHALATPHWRGERVQLLHMDDLYAGWDGLRAGGEVLTERILTPISLGRPGSYERYDWHAGAYAQTHDVPAGGLLIIEGVGSVRTEHAHLLSVIVDVRERDAATRLRRWRERDGPAGAAHAPEWMAAEAALHEDVGLAARATLRVDGEGRLVGGNVKNRE